MSFASKMFDSFGDNLVNDMHTFYPALIVSFDEVKNVAVIQPLYKFNDVDNYPQLQNVPVMKTRFKMKTTISTVGNHQHSYTWSDSGGSGTTGAAGTHNHTISFVSGTEEEVVFPMIVKPNDVVLCMVCEKALESVESRAIYKPMSQRKFDLTDSIIIGILYESS